MRTITTTSLVFVLTVVGARAQTVTINESLQNNMPEAYSVRMPIRVVENFTVLINSSDEVSPNSSDQAITAARRQLYRMMQAECSTLSESFNAECRIANFTITLVKNFVAAGSSAGAATTGANLRSVDASVSYGLKVKD